MVYGGLIMVQCSQLFVSATRTTRTENVVTSCFETPVMTTHQWSHHDVKLRSKLLQLVIHLFVIGWTWLVVEANRIGKKSWNLKPPVMKPALGWHGNCNTFRWNPPNEVRHWSAAQHSTESNGAKSYWTGSLDLTFFNTGDWPSILRSSFGFF